MAHLMLALTQRLEPVKMASEKESNKKGLVGTVVYNTDLSTGTVVRGKNLVRWVTTLTENQFVMRCPLTAGRY